MKLIFLTTLFLTFSSIASARIHCVEQAQNIAEAAYLESLGGQEQVGETAVTEKGFRVWEFDFQERQGRGMKITVTMKGQKDPGTHCDISKLIARRY